MFGVLVWQELVERLQAKRKVWAADWVQKYWTRERGDGYWVWGYQVGVSSHTINPANTKNGIKAVWKLQSYEACKLHHWIHSLCNWVPEGSVLAPISYLCFGDGCRFRRRDWTQIFILPSSITSSMKGQAWKSSVVKIMTVVEDNPYMWDKFERLCEAAGQIFSIPCAAWSLDCLAANESGYLRGKV